ncbi:uncharacterized protein LOC103953893 [Pyrus x bretschneideri]|uniref:uncharacterized protein LOC103953893 n=1 Tax=Pyrus x bretschneideri TaxID=225117 RepID=UPI00202F7C60|nr:uncharacterized protein LOC103953893 [Pyrus x bretschneideri]
MSWLFSSPRQPDDDDDPRDVEPKQPQNDLSFLRQTLGRQLRGVATFLAPPPSPPSNDALPSSNSQPQSQSQSQSPAILGIRNDLVEIGGSFKTGLSLLSTNSNKAVAEISKFASGLLQLQNEASEEGGADEDGDDGGGHVPGITDEVLSFVTEISVVPDCWTDFPMTLEHDFSMSDAQREHVSAVLQLVPGFADLRARLCNSMSEEQFWMIYFLLLLPRLNEHDFELLATPKIVEARDVLLHKLHNKRNTREDAPEKSILVSPKNHIQDGKAQGEGSSSQEKEASTEIVNTTERFKTDDEEGTEQWSEGASISSGTFVDGQRKHEPEDDISFSDLEDEENDVSSRQSGLRQGPYARACSPNGSNDWVQLNRSSENEGGRQKAGRSKGRDSEGEYSSDWLAVDEYD